MKIHWLIPPSSNVETVVRSLESTHHSHTVSMEFLGNTDINAILAKDLDLILYIGAVGGVHSISTENLLRLREKFDLILICYGDPGWEYLLDEYATLGVFKRTVVITGNEDLRRQKSDFITLCPVDPRPFEGVVEKDIPLGFIGGLPPARKKFLEQINELVTMGPRNEAYGSYDSYVAWLKRCKYLLNMNFFDESHYVQSVHMKIIEAGLAGAVFLEIESARTNQWFQQGVDYYRYKTAQDIREILQFQKGHECAKNLKFEINMKYSAKQFWKELL